jgi:hypothetical protein
MATNVELSTNETTPFYLSMRLITRTGQRPPIEFCDVTYADEPPMWARKDYCQPEPQFNCYGDEVPRHEWIYASAIFTPAPCLHSMKVTVRTYDDKISDSQLFIIAADEHKHVAEKAMREDLAHFVGTKFQNSAILQEHWKPLICDMHSNVEILDPVTGQHFWWILVEWEVHNPMAYPVRRRITEEEEGQEYEPGYWPLRTGCEESGRVEEGEKKQLELVEVNMNVEEEEEATVIETERRKENVDLMPEVMEYLFGREDHELDQIFAKHLE